MLIDAPEFWRCTAAYLGSSQAPVTILATLVSGSATVPQRRFTVSTRDGQRAGYASDTCAYRGGLVCRPVMCVFSFSVPAADVRGSLCVTTRNTSPGFRTICTEAR